MVLSYLCSSLAFESPVINQYFGNLHSDVRVWLSSLLYADNGPETRRHCRGRGHPGCLDHTPTPFCIPNSSNVCLELQHRRHRHSYQANCSPPTTTSKPRSEHQ